MHMATTTKRWTLEELHSLPDDGNKYELVRGELFVTPPPTPTHETIVARLSGLLEPYVRAQHLGLVYHPRSVVRFEGSEVEPDLMVRQPPPSRDAAWEDWHPPSLVGEVISESTRRRDRLQKREFYLAAAIGEYWIVDGEQRTVSTVRAGHDEVVERDRLVWLPAGVSVSLTIDLEDLFGPA
jgi:Uma2 family endonuclease